MHCAAWNAIETKNSEKKEIEIGDLNGEADVTEIGAAENWFLYCVLSAGNQRSGSILLAHTVIDLLLQCRFHSNLQVYHRYQTSNDVSIRRIVISGGDVCQSNTRTTEHTNTHPTLDVFLW